MVLMRLISLYMLTAVGLGWVINYFPGLMLPIYILAIIGLLFCLGHIAFHYIQRISMLLDKK
ncbi:hypothetical protein BK049_15390 [Bacillus xiamenensis]|uniref:Uncharacterized protein n=1 Tax=Bacillus xiamenensis TaxID=1178537 RepID=A0AAC9II69_9BACI|nr:hypothetical protein BK049_15390 [Bacillus xiamenensis]MBG9911071.1 hypothetical protein [Bacillus xiamenensis]